MVFPGKSRTTEMPLCKREQMCGASAFLSCEEHLTKSAMFRISFG